MFLSQDLTHGNPEAVTLGRTIPATLIFVGWKRKALHFASWTQKLQLGKPINFVGEVPNFEAQPKKSKNEKMFSFRDSTSWSFFHVTFWSWSPNPKLHLLKQLTVGIWITPRDQLTQQIGGIASAYCNLTHRIHWNGSYIPTLGQCLWEIWVNIPYMDPLAY